MMRGPTILHVDMDAFFAAVEQLDDPVLRGRPLVVGHDGPRGVVSAASYEARKFGCHSAQPIAIAKRLCPGLLIRPPRGFRYREMSERVFTIFESYTPLVEPLSIDEAFLDLAGTERIFGEAQGVAQRIRQQIREETGLTASVGVAMNKFLAKLASDLCKPDGLMVIRGEDIDRVLPPLPVTRIWGIGPKMAARLEEHGIRTIGDLRKIPDEWLRKRFGIDADHFLQLARGQDTRTVTPDHAARSLSQEHTFETNIADPHHVRDVLLGEVEHVACRLRRHGFRARAVGLKIRFGQFQTISRSATLSGPTDATQVLWESANSLYNQWVQSSFQPVRLIGMAARELVRGEGQMELFKDPIMEKHRKLDAALDRINDRFGGKAIGRGKR